MADRADRIAPAPAHPGPGATARDWLPSLVVPPVLLAGTILDHGTGWLTVGGVLAAVVGPLALGLRARLAPVLYAPVLTAGIALVVWQLNPGDIVVVIPMIALFDIAERGDRRRSWWLALISVPCVAVCIIPFTHGSDPAAAIGRNLTLCLLAIAAGDLVRTRHESGQRAVAVREQEMRHRLDEERLAVAHEIHDVVAHAMTAINVQAGVAAHLLERDPAHAHQALREIKRASGDALRDLRATLAVLRDPAQAAPLTAPSGLEDLDVLAESVRAAGVQVSVAVDPMGELPPRIHSIGYRIVQESLTNVVRHAGASAAWVVARREADAVSIEVRDDGRGRTGAGAMTTAGHGLRGMAERVAAVGGTLETGPGDQGGWRVRAHLPLSAAGVDTAPGAPAAGVDTAPGAPAVDRAPGAPAVDTAHGAVGVDAAHGGRT
ncbi:MAG TPA: sensor histidine kinase [Solirubrobacteraceae bacterium]|nr:sensor histidine kinase [Solirubrobacteraceae bacterium]